MKIVLEYKMFNFHNDAIVFCHSAVIIIYLIMFLDQPLQLLNELQNIRCSTYLSY